MQIDLASETLIRLEDARDHVPSSRQGKKLSRAVVYRWALQGVGGVKLETVKIGGGRFTSVQAIQRFIRARTSSPIPRHGCPRR